MIAKAREGATGIDFEVADLRDWRRTEPVDVLVSNATLQWVPDHLDLLPRFVAAVAPGGWLAFQVPGNFDAAQPHDPARARVGAGVRRPHPWRRAARAATAPRSTSAPSPTLDCTVDAWETTYLHVLQGDDPVFTWISSTGARPVLQALPPDLLERFTEEFKIRLRAAYPHHEHGVVLPFRRIFAVARTAA